MIILRKMCHRQMDRQTVDGQIKRIDFIRPLLQSWRLDHVSQKFENKNFLNYLTWLWAIWKEYKKKEYNQHSQRIQKQWSLANLCKVTFILQSNLYKTTILRATQKWSSWTVSCFIKCLYKKDHKPNLVILGRFLLSINHWESFINNKDFLE